MAENDKRTVTYGDVFEAAGVRWRVRDWRRLDSIDAGGRAEVAICYPVDAEGRHLPVDTEVKIGRAVRRGVRISVRADGSAWAETALYNERLTDAQRAAIAADLPSFDVPALTAAEVAEAVVSAVVGRVDHAVYEVVRDALPKYQPNPAHSAVRQALTPELVARVADEAAAAFRAELSGRLAAY